MGKLDYVRDECLELMIPPGSNSIIGGVVAENQDRGLARSFYQSEGIKFRLGSISLLRSGNLANIHRFVPSAVTPRFTATKINAQNKFQLMKEPGGAATTANEPYKTHSAV